MLVGGGWSMGRRSSWLPKCEMHGGLAYARPPRPRPRPDRSSLQSPLVLPSHSQQYPPALSLTNTIQKPPNNICAAAQKPQAWQPPPQHPPLTTAPSRPLTVNPLQLSSTLYGAPWPSLQRKMHPYTVFTKHFTNAPHGSGTPLTSSPQTPAARCPPPNHPSLPSSHRQATRSYRCA